MKPQQRESSRDAALEAAALLVEAYRRGRSEGGHVDWSDVDLAHEWARRALFDARRKSRNHRRPTDAAVANAQGRGSAPCEVLDVLDRRLTRIRELATSLVADGDEPQDQTLEAACELAALLLDLDSDARAGALPRDWQRSSRGSSG